MADPMYRQIADDLRNKIESGEIAPGEQLPTETELMQSYGASRNTVRDAVKWLTARWLVETQAGRGTFVTEKVNPIVATLTGDPRTGEERVYIEEVTREGRKPSFTVPRVENQQADHDVADALRIPLGADVVTRHQQRFIDGTPWSLQTSYYPISLVDAGAVELRRATNIEEGAVAYVARQTGVKQASYRDSISVRAPDENEISFFRLPADGHIPVFVIFRVAFDETGHRFRLTVTVYPADRNRFVINVGDVPTATPSVSPDQG